MSNNKKRAAGKSVSTRDVACAEKAEKTAGASAATPEPSAPARLAVVDHVFDKVTAWAAEGLTVARRGLEAGARWLDGRAKSVGELATRLGSSV